MKPTLVFAPATLALATLALAAMTMAAPAAETIRQNNRYTLVIVDDGFIRLDTQSGEIARCTGDPEKLTCRLAADERLAYVSEIERLESRIDDLEGRMAELEGAEAHSALKNTERYGLPTDKELDQVMTMTDRVFRRFFGLVRDLKRDLQQDEL